MSCRQFQDALFALARQTGDSEELARAREHLEACASCRREFERQAALTVRLRALAEADRDAQPSAALEGRLLATFAEERQPASTVAAAWGAWPVARRWWPVAAAVVLAVGGLVWWQVAGRLLPPQRTSMNPAAGIVEVADFTPLPLAFTLPDFERGEIVRTNLAVTALPVYGIAIPPDAAAPAVTVDFLVGQDGHPRAIRLVTGESQDSRSR